MQEERYSTFPDLPNHFQFIFAGSTAEIIHRVQNGKFYGASPFDATAAASGCSEIFENETRPPRGFIRDNILPAGSNRPAFSQMLPSRTKSALPTPEDWASARTQLTEAKGSVPAAF